MKVEVYKPTKILAVNIGDAVELSGQYYQVRADGDTGETTYGLYNLKGHGFVRIKSQMDELMNYLTTHKAKIYPKERYKLVLTEVLNA